MQPHSDDPDADNQLVSAIVAVRADASTEGPPVENPIDVVSEAAAVIGGVDLGPGPAPATPAGDAGDVDLPGQGDAMAKVKGYFTKAGFEVHAPLLDTFSIAARRTFFEDFFGTQLVVDEEKFFAPVTTVDGGDKLPVEVLPEEIRALVESVSLPPPPELPEGLNL